MMHAMARRMVHWIRPPTGVPDRLAAHRLVPRVRILYARICLYMAGVLAWPGRVRASPRTDAVSPKAMGPR